VPVAVVGLTCAHLREPQREQRADARQCRAPCMPPRFAPTQAAQARGDERAGGRAVAADPLLLARGSQPVRNGRSRFVQCDLARLPRLLTFSTSVVYSNHKVQRWN
jgi:hypothetical protein